MAAEPSQGGTEVDDGGGSTKESLPTLPFSFAEWKTLTSLGPVSRRNNDKLLTLDKAIEKYHQQTSDYGKKWQLEECRIALDQWKASAGDKWHLKKRNQNQAFSKLDAALPLPKPVPTEPSAAQEESAENMRKGTLFFLKNVELSLGVPGKLMDLASSGVAAGSGVKELIDAAKPDDVTAVASTVKEGGLWDSASATAPNGPPDMDLSSEEGPSGFIKMVLGSVKDLLAKLKEAFPGDAAEEAINWIKDQIPEAVSNILGAVFQHIGLAVGVGKNLKQAVEAAYDLFKTRNLDSGILPGQPSLVIESVRDQIAKFGLAGLAAALEKALMAGITAANPAVGSVVGAVKSILTFVIKAFLYFREMWKCNKLLKDAKVQYEAELWKRSEEYVDWYTKAIDGLPIIACYCLAMPMTGSYFGFMSTTSNGLQFTQDQLKATKDLFDLVKGRARQFIGASGIKFKTEDPLVGMSLQAVDGKPIDLTKRHEEEEKKAAAAKQHREEPHEPSTTSGEQKKDSNDPEPTPEPTVGEEELPKNTTTTDADAVANSTAKPGAGAFVCSACNVTITGAVSDPVFCVANGDRHF